MNPYTWLPIYGEDYVRKVNEAGIKDRASEPHIYSIAEQAYTQMRLNHSNQSILITGESGAGKTENTKKVIQYFAYVAASSVVKKEEPGVSLNDPYISPNLYFCLFYFSSLFTNFPFLLKIKNKILSFFYMLLI